MGGHCLRLQGFPAHLLGIAVVRDMTVLGCTSILEAREKPCLNESQSMCQLSEERSMAFCSLHTEHVVSAGFGKPRERSMSSPGLIFWCNFGFYLLVYAFSELLLFALYLILNLLLLPPLDRLTIAYPKCL